MTEMTERINAFLAGRFRRENSLPEGEIVTTVTVNASGIIGIIIVIAIIISTIILTLL